MRYLTSIVIHIFIGNIACLAQYRTIVHNIYSENVKDSFEIYISKPENYTNEKKYDLIFYCDANLKSGKELRKQVEAYHNLSKEGNYIFVGIGHIGNYQILRRRDFILPFIISGDTVTKSSEVGHIREFYSFLTSELLTAIQSSYSCSDKRTIIGHSLGGLFVFYCLFQNEPRFTNYMALSPSLWIDKYSIYNFNKIKDSLKSKSYLYFSAGSKETINRILSGTGEMNNFLVKKKYINLRFDYKVHRGKTHNTQIPESLKEILKSL